MQSFGRTMNTAKVKSFIGFAIKAGKALFGVDLILTSRHAPRIVLIDNSLSDNSKNKLNGYLNKNSIRSYTVDMEALYSGKNCKAVGVMDKNLAQAIELELKES